MTTWTWKCLHCQETGDADTEDGMVAAADAHNVEAEHDRPAMSYSNDEPPTEADLDAQAAATETLIERAQGAIDTLEQGLANWGTLTAAQKDAELKLAVRVVVALARLKAARLDGVV